MSSQQLASRSESKILWMEIKQIEFEFKKHQDIILAHQKAMEENAILLKVKLDRIQELAEISDAETMKAEIENDFDITPQFILEQSKILNDGELMQLINRYGQQEHDLGPKIYS